MAQAAFLRRLRNHVVVGTLKSAFSFFISAVVHELQLVQEFSRTSNPAVTLGIRLLTLAYSYTTLMTTRIFIVTVQLYNNNT